MIIAVATNDRKTIAKRTGRASEFAFFKITGNEIIEVTYEKNDHDHHDHDRSEGHHRQGRRGKGLGQGHGQGYHHHHEEEHSHDEVIKQLKDVDMFLVRAVGKHMRHDLEHGNIPFKLVKGENLTDIVKNYLKDLSE